jgi:sugar phosphate isomerase/epimerase
MGGDLVTAHLSDVRDDGKMCLPGKGITDFKDVFSRLNDVGFDGAVLLEVYKSDFEREEQLFECLDYLQTEADKIF